LFVFARPIALAAARAAPSSAGSARSPTVTSPGPIHAFTVSAMTLTNVTIAGQIVDTTICDKR